MDFKDNSKGQFGMDFSILCFTNCRIEHAYSVREGKHFMHIHVVTGIHD